jgi:hypothetical protein
MNDEIRGYLDGDLPLESLPSSERPEAEAWDRLLDSLRATTPGGDAPPWLEQKVMAEIEALPARGRLNRVLDWLLRPQPVRVPPLVAGLAVIAMVALVLRTPTPGAPDGPVGADPGQAMVYVQFNLSSPGARSVSVGGDFDDWGGSHALADPDGDGVWTGRIPVRPGVHAYMFLVDGATWVTDPLAERYADDGFGNRNAVLAVTTPEA